MRCHLGKVGSKMIRQGERELQPGAFPVVFEGRHERCKVNNQSKLIIGYLNNSSGLWALGVVRIAWYLAPQGRGWCPRL